MTASPYIDLYALTYKLLGSIKITTAGTFMGGDTLAYLDWGRGGLQGVGSGGDGVGEELALVGQP